jgi:hypothetical protein
MKKGSGPFSQKKGQESFFAERMHPVQLAGFRRMTPAQKLRMVARLYEAAMQLKVQGLRSAHPDWPRERLERIRGTEAHRRYRRRAPTSTPFMQGAVATKRYGPPENGVSEVQVTIGA